MGIEHRLSLGRHRHRYRHEYRHEPELSIGMNTGFGA
jgi:hypothetical protein